ncbi:DUF3037 domain-containing protein [Miltoncostaea marina]|uniref:DUF3037 domain-containing protein n=1 Tax=Miltoncostaea marina TaxID=2843215 RepID=UPI001C3CE23D|nr:DUF3037 domain-containing protein [Miltoncostaea marina]
MPGARNPFQYAVLRVVPSLERGECVNAGVVLFARTADFLGLRTGLDPARLRALSPETDPGPVLAHLAGLERVARGEPDAGPIARMPRHGRFHWLVAPSSTIVQPSAVHTGVCDDPAAMLDHLHDRLVRPGPAPGAGPGRRPPR